jgi:hypothetical protein
MEPIARLSAQLTECRSDNGDAGRVCAELFEIFSTLAALQTTSDATSSRQLANGLALSPALAANCLLDGRRTQAFVRGTIAAIREASQRFAPGPIEVVYAGHPQN